MQKGNIILETISNDNQLIDIFTKPLSKDRFCAIQRELGILNVCSWNIYVPEIYDHIAHVPKYFIYDPELLIFLNYINTCVN